VLLLDTATASTCRRTARRIGYVFQDARLFPHLTVRRTCALWPLVRARRGARRARFRPRSSICWASTRCWTAAPARCRAARKQRVAIGRAILSNPRLLVMDEPLAALDEARKAEILPYLERLRDEMGLPILYVSHSVPEVLRLATTVVRDAAEGSLIACRDREHAASQAEERPPR
jgi:molybdate transport system ATP-binding protein